MLIAKLKIAGMAMSIALMLGVGGAWVAQTATAEPATYEQAVGAFQPVSFQEPEERREGDRPREERKDGAKPRPEERKDGQRPRAEERREGDRPREERKDGAKPRAEERKDGQRPRAEEPREGDRPREERGTRGVIKAIDLKAGTITIQSLRDGDRGAHTFSLAGKDIAVHSPSERKASLGDLAPGLRVVASLNDSNEVAAIRIEPVTGFGFVIRADVARRTLTLRMPREGERPAEATFKLAPDAGVVINGRRGELADLDQGVRVQLVLDLDRQTVLSVRAGEPQRDGERRPEREGDRPRDADRPREGERDGDRAGRLYGTIVDIDQGKGTINVLVGRDPNLAITTLKVAKDAPVKIMFHERPVQELTFSQLTKPAAANLTLDSGKTVTAINISAPSQRARIKSVDAEKRTITFDSEERGQTMELAVDAKVLAGRQEMRLTQLEPGTMVLVGLSPDRRHVIGIQIIRGDGERE